jgi:hypothetical protein
VKTIVIAVSALILVVTGCGGVENEPNLSKAVERTEAMGSSRIAVRATLKEGDNTVDFRCEGAANYARKHVRLACNQGFGEMIAIGETLYVTSDAFGVQLDQRWVKVPDDETDSLSNVSPEKLLAMLRDASVQTDRVGEDEVRAVSTVRYRLTVNCEEAQITCPGTTAPVDVWIDDEGLVRRIALEDGGSPATIEFFDFGVEVDIEAPSPDKVANLGVGWAGYGPQDPNAARCAPGEARPISESQALETLRRHGLGVRSDENGCFGAVAAVLENTPEDFEKQGYVSCFLYSEQPDQAPRVVDRRGADGADARLALANLVCTILADSPNAEEKIRPLEQAFEELQRAIRP